MPTGKITKRTVDELEAPTSGVQFLWDTTVKGFGIYVTARGCKTYVLQYRMGGRGSRLRRYTIGRHGDPWTPEAARNRALDLKIKVRERIDPLEEERKARQPKVDPRLLIPAYVETYLKHHVQARKLRRAHEIRQILERDIVPPFRDKPINEITRREVVALLDKLGERSRGAAMSGYAQLRTMMNFARKRGDIDVNPVEGLDPPVKYDHRDRFLTDPEIQLVWAAASDLDPFEEAAVKLLLLTGMRRDEVMGLRFEELDFERNAWIIPKNRSKNKREHLLPLTERLRHFIEERWPGAATRTGFLFTRDGQTQIRDHDARKKRLDAAIRRRIGLMPEEERRELPHFVFHDLRRTVATGMQRLGIPEAHTEALLNHISGTRGGIVGVYQRHKYEDEKLVALTKWHAHLDRLMKQPDAWPGGKDLPKITAASRRCRRSYAGMRRGKDGRILKSKA
jgi:integrase